MFVLVDEVHVVVGVEGDAGRAVELAVAQAVGTPSVLVKTGKYRQELLERSDIVPDAIIDSIAELKILL